MLKYGIEYDHSMSHHDCQPYYLRKGDKWTKIDYSKNAEEWMKPLEKGPESGLVEIPGSWYIDDLPPMVFYIVLSTDERLIIGANPMSTDVHQE